MYIVGITDEDFIGSEAEMKDANKQMLKQVREENLASKNLYSFETLRHSYMFQDATMGGGSAGSSRIREKAATIA